MTTSFLVIQFRQDSSTPYKRIVVNSIQTQNIRFTPPRPCRQSPPPKNPFKETALARELRILKIRDIPIGKARAIMKETLVHELTERSLPSFTKPWNVYMATVVCVISIIIFGVPALQALLGPHSLGVGFGLLGLSGLSFLIAITLSSIAVPFWRTVTLSEYINADVYHYVPNLAMVMAERLKVALPDAEFYVRYLE